MRPRLLSLGNHTTHCPCLLSASSFNEAEAVEPRKPNWPAFGRGWARRFNEAEAVEPRKHASQAASNGAALASMRPRLLSLGNAVLVVLIGIAALLQ